MRNKKNGKTVLLLVILAVLITVLPFLALKGASFGGSDDAGSDMVRTINGEDYTPWFEPILEQYIGGEVPGEIESLIFCVQTGIGTAIIAYLLGRLYERNKGVNAVYLRKEAEKKQAGNGPQGDKGNGKIGGDNR